MAVRATATTPIIFIDALIDSFNCQLADTISDTARILELYLVYLYYSLYAHKFPHQAIGVTNSSSLYFLPPPPSPPFSLNAVPLARKYHTPYALFQSH